jgi:hypothetical protein
MGKHCGASGAIQAGELTRGRGCQWCKNDHQRDSEENYGGTEADATGTRAAVHRETGGTLEAQMRWL